MEKTSAAAVMDLSDVESFHFLVKCLWNPGTKTNSSGAPRYFSADIPDTLLFCDGRPCRWLFSSETDKVKFTVKPFYIAFHYVAPSNIGFTILSIIIVFYSGYFEKEIRPLVDPFPNCTNIQSKSVYVTSSSSQRIQVKASNCVVFKHREMHKLCAC